MKLGTGLLGAAFAAWAVINDGVGGVKVGLGKTPPGKIVAYAASDPAGNLRMRVPEAGRYVVEIAQPAPLPFWVNLNGEVRALAAGAGQSQPIAQGKMFPQSGPAGARLAIPGVPFNRQNGIFREEVEFGGPAELILRATEGPPLGPPAAPASRPAMQSGPARPPDAQAFLGSLIKKVHRNASMVPLITYRPPRPLVLAPGAYSVVNRRTGTAATGFIWNSDGTITAPMIPKAGGGDNSGGGGCTVCKPDTPDCFEYKQLPHEAHYFELMVGEDTKLNVTKPGGTAPSPPAGSTTCTESAKVGVRWLDLNRPATLVQ